MDAKYLKSPPEIAVHDEVVMMRFEDGQVLVMHAEVAEAWAHYLSRAALSAEMGRSEVIHKVA